MAYGDTRQIQLMLYGAEDTSRVESIDASREQATALINARLNYDVELSDPPESLHTCTNLITAGLIATRESGAKSELLTQGESLLEQLTNDLPSTQTADYQRVFQQEW